MQNNLKNQIEACKYRGYRKDLSNKLNLCDATVDKKLRNGDIFVVDALFELALERKNKASEVLDRINNRSKELDIDFDEAENV